MEKYGGLRADAFYVGLAIRVAVPGSLFPAKRPGVPAPSYYLKGPPRGKDRNGAMNRHLV